jgi:uncharacterized membrane protein YjjP (DUF1212 family)
MTDPETNRRFDRLEAKIDKLTEVLTNVKRHEFRLDEGEKKLEEVAEQVATNSQVVKVGQGLVASIWAALLGFVFYLFRE